MSVDAVTVMEILPETQSQPGPDAPRIAVVVPLYFPDFNSESRDIVLRFTRSAIAMLCEQGARIEIVDPSSTDRLDLERISGNEGFVFLGGGDIHPSFYGADGFPDNSYGIDRDIDQRSIAVLQRVRERDAPLLAICRGAQLLNVYHGGSLIGDLVPPDLHHGGEGEPVFLDETVDIFEDSKIAAILGPGERVVRSGHHQAIDTPGEGLRVAARARDGVVEAVESIEADWAVGLQWHPEDPAGSRADFQRLVQSLLRAVERQRVEKS